MNKTVIILAGPTAVGKTDISIQLARYFNTSIISADSRQCFKELSIGVAKPDPEQLHQVPHYFINSHSVTETVTAADFEKYALNIAGDLFKTADVVILTGGTGLYIRAFCQGLDEIPAPPEGIRNDIIANYEKHGIKWLQQQLTEIDPAFLEQGEAHNPHRLIRALEVIQSTGKSILEYRKGNVKKREFDIIKICLHLPIKELYERINKRVDKMMSDGLLDEVKGLVPYRNLNALQTVGYNEIFQYLDGEITLEHAVEEIKKHTRHYAKRQNTWFRKDKEFVHCNAVYEDVIALTIAKCSGGASGE